MSDDLISRKAVIDYLREQNNNVIIERHKDGFISEDGFRGLESAISAFRNFILTLPTAFDKEKVIKEIKEKYEHAAHWEVIQGICEIVEKGGIE